MRAHYEDPALPDLHPWDVAAAQYHYGAPRAPVLIDFETCGDGSTPDGAYDREGPYELSGGEYGSLGIYLYASVTESRCLSAGFDFWDLRPWGEVLGAPPGLFTGLSITNRCGTGEFGIRMPEKPQTLSFWMLAATDRIGNASLRAFDGLGEEIAADRIRILSQRSWLNGSGHSLDAREMEIWSPNGIARFEWDLEEVGIVVDDVTLKW
jgi:hypothetical protein